MGSGHYPLSLRWTAIQALGKTAAQRRWRAVQSRERQRADRLQALRSSPLPSGRGSERRRSRHGGGSQAATV